MKSRVKFAIFLSCALLVGASDAVGQSGWYRRKDYAYFRPMIADIRRPVTHMRIYTEPPVRFTNAKKTDKRSFWDGENFPPIWRRGDGEHRFWDVAFAGKFSLLGRHDDKADLTAPGGLMKIRGFDLFIEPAAHMLLDFNANSNAVINIDFRIGGGISGRSVPGFYGCEILRHFSWQIKVFHECTHLGDEFVIDAFQANQSLDSTIVHDASIPFSNDYFQRYNVGYNPIEFFLAIDDFRRANKPVNDRYWRLYTGIRFLKWRLSSGGPHPAFLTYQDESIPSDVNLPLISGRTEFQIGGEYLDRIEKDKWAPNPNLIVKVVNPILTYTVGLGGYLFKDPWERADFLVVAGELYHRPQYNTRSTDKVWGQNWVVGMIWGEQFKVDKSFTNIGLQINYYNGPNPHGQFRESDLSYWGIDLIVGL